MRLRVSVPMKFYTTPAISVIVPQTSALQPLPCLTVM